MEIRIAEKNDVAMQLFVQGVNVPFMNVLRRIVLAEVPSMAIDDVVIIENSSVLQDEILAHRLGLIPIKTDLDSYNLPEECPCKSEFGCNLCRASLTLEIEASNDIKTVYSGDLKPENPDIVPISDRVPIVKLVSGQKIKLEAYARLGKGKAHAKWQPVTVCAYRHLPPIKIGESHCDGCNKLLKAGPKRVLIKAESKKGGTQGWKELALCQKCAKTYPLNTSAIEFAWDQEAFIFNIESTGALPPERIMMEALNILDKKVKDFFSELKKRKSKAD